MQETFYFKQNETFKLQLFPLCKKSLLYAIQNYTDCRPKILQSDFQHQ